MRKILIILMVAALAACGNVLPQPSVKETINKQKALAAQFDQECQRLGYVKDTGDYQQCISLSAQRYDYDAALKGMQTQGAVSAGAAMLPLLFMFSDVRLKTNIVRVGQLPNGIPLYRFNYRWSPESYVGVLAQDIQTVRPDAVATGTDGYLRVDYAKLGVHLMTWQDWTQIR